MKTPGSFLPRVKGTGLWLVVFLGASYLPVIPATMDAEIVNDHFSAFAGRARYLFKTRSTSAAKISNWNQDFFLAFRAVIGKSFFRLFLLLNGHFLFGGFLFSSASF